MTSCDQLPNSVQPKTLLKPPYSKSCKRKTTAYCLLKFHFAGSQFTKKDRQETQTFIQEIFLSYCKATGYRSGLYKSHDLYVDVDAQHARSCTQLTFLLDIAGVGPHVLLQLHVPTGSLLSGQTQVHGYITWSTRSWPTQGAPFITHCITRQPTANHLGVAWFSNTQYSDISLSFHQRQ